MSKFPTVEFLTRWGTRSVIVASHLGTGHLWSTLTSARFFFVVFVVVVNYKKNLWKVADSLFGWTDFRESYGNNLWSWLVAALTPKYLKDCPRSMVTVITSGFTLPVPLWVRNRFAESAVGTLSLSVSICNFIPSFSNPWSEKRRHQTLLQRPQEKERISSNSPCRGDIY